MNVRDLSLWNLVTSTVWKSVREYEKLHLAEDMF